MLWIAFSLASAFLRSLGNISTRTFLRKKKVGVITSSFLFTFISSLFFIPGVIAEGFNLNYSAFAWLLALSAGFLWFIINLVGFSSYKFTEVSLREPLSNIRIILTFFLGILLLSEVFTLSRFMGAVLIFVGSVVLTWHKGKIFGKLGDKGVQLTLLTTLLCSITAVIDKKAMAFFPVSFYGFIVFLLPAMFILPLVLKKGQSLSKLKGNKRMIALSSFFVTSAYFFELHAYKLADISLVFPVIRLSTLLTVVLGTLILNEKGEFKQRLFGSLIMILGVVIITLF